MIYNKINTEINEMIRKIEKEEHILNMKIYRLCKRMYDDGNDIEIIYHFLNDNQYPLIGDVIVELFKNNCF
jgi:hypothetical protein